MYAVYLLKKSERSVIDKILSDDIIGRQTVIQKDGGTYGLPEDKIILLYEGSDQANERLKELFKANLELVPATKAEEIYKKIKDENSQAEGGMGFLFG